MVSISTLHAMLPALLTELESAANRSDLLASKLSERARIAYNSEHNDPKPHRGIAWSHVCATESDVAVAEPEEAPRSFIEVSQSATVKEEHDSSLDSHVVDELLAVSKSENAFGRKKEKDQLISQLLDPIQGGSQLSVIPIVGMGGLGKTTLARLVYEDQEVQEHFELKAWVKMGGPDETQHCDIARKLLKSATGVLFPLNDLDQLDEMVVDALLSQRSLIVLDGFESMDTERWVRMKDSWFRFVGLGSKVIITTRKQQVASNIVASEAFALGELSPDDCWSLYSSLAFSNSRETEHAGMIPAAKQLVARCKGVPLSLKLLGSLMRFEESLLEEISSPDIMKKITSFLDDSFVLSVTVLALPLDLFKCFAYCGIFPCGYVLDKEKLIKTWIADGVVKPSVGVKSMEDIGEAYFHQLLCRSFFTDIICNEYGEVMQARMPSVIHEVSQQMAKIISKHKVGYVGGVDKNCDELSVALPFREKYSPRHLQTLVSLSAKNLYRPNPNRSFVEFKRLQSLDLSRSGIRSLSKHICRLRKLRYLNLSNTLLTKLPKSFTSLARLQTLDLSGCYYLKYLPKKISNLSQLRHLDLSQCNSLHYMPFGIGRLSSLITMTLYVLCDKGSGLVGLGKLDELRGVLLIRNLENVREISEAEAADLKHKRLHHLGLSWSHKVDECHTVLECLQPNPELRVLDLTGYGAYGFPSWMPNLHNLVKLVINDCKCTKLPTLGKLAALKELQLKELINIRSIGQEFYGDIEGDEDHFFPSLEKLKLHGMPNLNSWLHAEGPSSSRVFPSLKRLSIQDCPELQSLPSLPRVTELVVWRSHSKILPLLTRNKSVPSSIVISDMDVKESFGGLNSSNSVKKLIIVRSTDLDALESSDVNKFKALEHLRILYCMKLKYVKFSRLGSLQKLNVVDCQNLKEIHLPREKFTLTELVIEDCPQLERIDFATAFASTLRKLIVRNCSVLSISPSEIGELRGLEFLCISGCLQTKKLLDVEMLQLSHVPCVILDK